MNQILGYLEKTVDGIGRYGAANKLLVCFFAVLLFVWLAEKKEISKGQNRFLVYSLFLTVVLLFPMTAVAVLIYQTPFYDYEWAWSMVPVTAVIAFGIVILWEQELSKKKKGLLAAVMVVILCLCGNQGRLQKIPEQEALVKVEIDSILEGVYSASDTGKPVLWGPSGVMQEARRQNGNIKLVYGRDMWDKKAGAYDYEAYSDELTEAYVWLEETMVHYAVAAVQENPKETLRFLEEQYDWTDGTERHVEEVIKAGADTIVLPSLIGDYIEESMRGASAAQNKVMKSVSAGEYSIYRIN